MAPRVTPHADTVAFDMDGTLVDSTETAVEGARAGLARFYRDLGVEPALPDPGTIRRMIGMPSLEYFAALVPAPYRDCAAKIREYVSVEEVRLIAGGSTRLFPGALDVLAWLRGRGYRLILVSNCGPVYFDAVRRHCGLAGRFDREYCLAHAPRGDKASALERALRELGSRSAVMVGDKKYDLDAGRANGMKVIGCRYGFHAPHELDGADAWVDAIGEVPALLPEAATR